MGLDFNSVTRLNVSSLASSLVGAAGDAHQKRSDRPTLYVATDGRKAMVPKYMTKKAEPGLPVAEHVLGTEGIRAALAQRRCIALSLLSVAG
ncbi:hypothetical protein [Mycolicibacterium sp.]|uniref:hypothetical protein n=1 Tax=Mycolicibacterium sp. TaxID=2320850 RepID=UPI0037CB476A